MNDITGYLSSQNAIEIEIDSSKAKKLEAGLS